MSIFERRQWKGRGGVGWQNVWVRLCRNCRNGKHGIVCGGAVCEGAAEGCCDDQSRPYFALVCLILEPCHVSQACGHVSSMSAKHVGMKHVACSHVSSMSAKQVAISAKHVAILILKTDCARPRVAAGYEFPLLGLCLCLLCSLVPCTIVTLFCTHSIATRLLSLNRVSFFVWSFLYICFPLTQPYNCCP